MGARLHSGELKIFLEVIYGMDGIGGASGRGGRLEGQQPNVDYDDDDFCLGGAVDSALDTRAKNIRVGGCVCTLRRKLAWARPRPFANLSVKIVVGSF